MSASALLQPPDQPSHDSRPYFRTFPQYLDLHVTAVHRIRPFSFERVLDLMLEDDTSNFVIDSHGDPTGLSMPLVHRRGAADATRETVERLIKVGLVARDVEEAGNNERSWSRLLDSIGETMPATEVPWLERVTPGPESDLPQRLEQARAMLRKWREEQAAHLAIGREDLDRLVQKLRRVQAKGIEKVQFVTCNIGRHWQTLQAFRRLFQAKRVGAPDVRSGFAAGVPLNLGRGRFDRVVQRHPDARVYGRPGHRFAIHVVIQGGGFTATAAAESGAAVEEWVQSHVTSGGSRVNLARRRRLPLHFLELDRPPFARDRAYRDHLTYSSHIWYVEMPA